MEKSTGAHTRSAASPAKKLSSSNLASGGRSSKRSKKAATQNTHDWLMFDVLSQPATSQARKARSSKRKKPESLPENDYVPDTPEDTPRPGSGSMPDKTGDLLKNAIKQAAAKRATPGASGPQAIETFSGAAAVAGPQTSSRKKRQRQQSGNFLEDTTAVLREASIGVDPINVVQHASLPGERNPSLPGVIPCSEEWNQVQVKDEPQQQQQEQGTADTEVIDYGPDDDALALLNSVPDSGDRKQQPQKVVVVAEPTARVPEIIVQGDQDASLGAVGGSEEKPPSNGGGDDHFTDGGNGSSSDFNTPDSVVMKCVSQMEKDYQNARNQGVNHVVDSGGPGGGIVGSGGHLVKQLPSSRLARSALKQEQEAKQHIPIELHPPAAMMPPPLVNQQQAQQQQWVGSNQHPSKNAPPATTTISLAPDFNTYPPQPLVKKSFIIAEPHHNDISKGASTPAVAATLAAVQRVRPTPPPVPRFHDPTTAAAPVAVAAPDPVVAPYNNYPSTSHHQQHGGANNSDVHMVDADLGSSKMGNSTRSSAVSTVEQQVASKGGEEPDYSGINQMVYDAMSESDSEDGSHEPDIPMYTQPGVTFIPPQKVTTPLKSPFSSNRMITQPRPSISPLKKWSGPASNKLSSYLGADICAAYYAMGMKEELYDWQAECLIQPGVLQGRNLVYCAPTSGGKSVVAEIIMLHRIVQTKRPALLVLPFVTLCSEKSRHLNRLLAATGKEVKDFYGGLTSHATLTPSTGVIICTIERANILVNRLLEAEDGSMKLDDLSCVVVDELHMVGDAERGYQLELLLTKLRYYNADNSGPDDLDLSVDGTLKDGLQIVGMSATLPNVDVVAKWLNAALYRTNWRPIPLKQMILADGMIRYHNNAIPPRQLYVPREWDLFWGQSGSKNINDDERAVWLAKETVDQGHSALIFCATKANCRETAKMIKDHPMFVIRERQLRHKQMLPSDSETDDTDGPEGQLDELWKGGRRAIAAQLSNINSPLVDFVLEGVAYHNADLSYDERFLIETAYRCGAVSVLCATSTLAAGVNLPARRVIFRQPKVGKDLLDATKYRQMAGRAGRAGIDEEGESILIYHPKHQVARPRVEELFTKDPPPIESCLTDEKQGMKRAILEVIAAGIVRTPEHISQYITCTLMAAIDPSKDGPAPITTTNAINWLGRNKFITWMKQPGQDNDQVGEFAPTEFGKAAMCSGLPPELCITIKADLEKARSQFVMTTELHLTYLCVPILEEINIPNYERYFEIVKNIQDGTPAYAVMKNIGLNLSYIYRATKGTKKTGSNDDRVAKRFFIALILNDLLQEIPVDDVARKFCVQRPEISGLQERAAKFAGMVAAFCERLGWWEMDALIAKFQARVLHGARPEVLSLTEIPTVKTITARVLYKGGLRSPEMIANVRIEDLVDTLVRGLHKPGTNPDRNKYRLIAQRIQKGANKLLMEKAAEMKEAAEQALNRVTKPKHFEAGNNAGYNYHPREPSSPVFEAAANIISPPGSVGRRQLPPPPPPQQYNQQRAPQRVHFHPGIQNTSDTTAAPPTAATYNNFDAEEEEYEDEEVPPDESIMLRPEHFAPEQLEPADEWRLKHQRGAYILTDVNIVTEMVNLLLSKGEMTLGFKFDGDVNTSHGTNSHLIPTNLPGKTHQNSSSMNPDGVSLPKIKGVALCWRHDSCVYIPFIQSDRHKNRVDRHDLVAQVALLFASSKIEKVTWDLKRQLALLYSNYGPAMFTGGLNKYGQKPPLVIRALCIDVRLAAFLLSPDDPQLQDGNTEQSFIHSNRNKPAGKVKPYELRTFYSRKVNEEELQVVCASLTQGQAVSPELVYPIARQQYGHHFESCRDASLCQRLFKKLKPILNEQGLMSPLLSIEMPLVPVLVEMEAAGMAVDTKVLKTEQGMLQSCLRKVKRQVHEEARALGVLEPGKTLDIMSSKAVSMVLFDDRPRGLGLKPPPNSRRFKKGTGFGNGKDVMAELTATFPDVKLPALITEYRHLEKLQTTYALALDGHAKSGVECDGKNEGQKLKRISGSFNQTCAATGRLAMDEPNLQTIPKACDINVLISQPYFIDDNDSYADTDLTPAGNHRTLRSNMRAAFVAPKGKAIVSADYCQLEYRLMAHFSADEKLVEIFRDDNGRDPFRVLAAYFLHKEYDQVTPEDRNRAKQLTYALLYGMGTGRLAANLKIKEFEARELSDKFKKSVPGVIAWCEAWKKRIQNRFDIKTIAGRKRSFPQKEIPGDSERTRELVGANQRCAVNSICQGSASDVSKAAMLAVRERLIREKKEEACKLILQIHDEFLYEVDEHQVDYFCTLIREEMENVAQLRVPLKVRLQKGPSWGELEEYRPGLPVDANGTNIQGSTGSSAGARQGYILMNGVPTVRPEERGPGQYGLFMKLSQ